ncbi:MAG: glycosyltransferase family 4 protein [Bacteroidales bacterium]|jgi:glycosyltransferase involved in cell wall biosynthesis|nr:glycosyltransferase family 4 protein [Bacteroidales bacterium]
MRIAILLLNKGRGSGEVARQHVRFLLKQGHNVYFMHPEIGDGVLGANNIDIKLHSDIMPVHEYLPSAGEDQKQVASMSYAEMMAYLPDYERALEQIIHDVDIVIGHHANITAIATNRVAKKHNKPYVLFLHGTGIEPRHEGMWVEPSWEMIKKAVLQASGIIVTTEYVRDELVMPIINIPENKFLILPCGVDLDDFRAENTYGIRAKYNLPEKYVICPGALTASKGPQNVVEASKEYSEYASTVFIGDGELKDELKKNLGDRGLFFGYVSSEDKAKLINEATLLVAAPEKKEHFGIIYAEALAAGTPVVAYEGGGVGSIITPTEGILTERNPKILGQKINYLLQNSGLRKQMSISCRARAETDFSYPKLVKTLSEWLINFID